MFQTKQLIAPESLEGVFRTHVDPLIGALSASGGEQLKERVATAVLNGRAVDTFGDALLRGECRIGMAQVLR